MRIEIYDNGGKTIDRYTVVIERQVYGMSHNPKSLHGFNQYSHTLRKGQAYKKGTSAGKKIAFENLPDEVQMAISERILGIAREHLS